MLNQARELTLAKKLNNKDPKFKIGDIAGISNYKNIFTKDYIPSWSEEVFVILMILMEINLLDLFTK